jgi:putative ABC transport system permease protein
MMSMMFGMMDTMVDAVTYVLVAFTSISLVVSSVMISIITYTSVVERTKEIGVLRSLGASKKEISSVFNAETFLIGLFSGLIGVGVTYLLSIPINLIIGSLVANIGTIAVLNPLSAFVLVVISVGLTLIAGLIPARIASKKDPVIALRTE